MRVPLSLALSLSFVIAALSPFAGPADAGHPGTIVTVCPAGGTCDFPGDLQAAIDHANPGDTIEVAAGSYPLTTYIRVTKPLTIFGPQAGVDPRPSAGSARVAGSSATEAVFDRQGGPSVVFWIEASDVTLDGLDVRGSDNRDMIITAFPFSVSNVAIRNTIVHDATGAEDGIQLRRCTSCVVEQNYVFNVPDTGISVNGGSTGGFVADVVIRNNEIADVFDHGGIYVYGPATDILVEGNVVRGSVGDAAIHVLCTPGGGAGTCAGPVEIRGNDVRGVSGGSAIRIRTDHTPILVEANLLRDNAAVGVSVQDTSTAGGHVTLLGNEIAGNTAGVVHTVPAGWTGPDLLAEYNWWGAPSGPFHGSLNAGGAGNSASDHVDFTPWLGDAPLSGPVRIVPSVLNTCPGQSTFSFIASALACAAFGAKILLDPGTYHEAVTILQDGVTLCQANADRSDCGSDPSQVVLDPNGMRLYALFIGDPLNPVADITIEGITIQNPALLSSDRRNMDGTPMLTPTPVDPSVVAVYGDRVTLRNLVLQDAAAPLLPGDSRWHTVGANFGTGSDDVLIEDVLIRRIPLSAMTDGACANEPCSTHGILNWGGGSGFVVRRTTIEMDGGGCTVEAVTAGACRLSGKVLGIQGSASGHSGAVIEDNVVTANLPGDDGTIGGTEGLRGNFPGGRISGNSLSGWANVGAVVWGDGLLVEENRFATNAGGLMVCTGAAQSVERNVFEMNLQAMLVTRCAGASTGLVLRDNVMGLTNEVALHFRPSMSGYELDARENEWGLYSNASIRSARIEDAGSGNRADISCFVDADGATKVCPTADFTHAVSGSTWPRSVTVTDASTGSGRDVVDWEWTFPGGVVKTGASASHTLPPGSHSVTLRVEDEEGFVDYATKTISLSNAAPVLAFVPNDAAPEGSVVLVSLSATDADGDPLTYSVTPLPPGGSIVPTPTGAVFRWEIPYDMAGLRTFTARASDGALDDTQSFDILVADTNRAPVVGYVPDRVHPIAAGTMTQRIVAQDADGDPVTLSVTGLPAASLVDHGDGTGTLTWAPGVGDIGTYPVCAIADDGAAQGSACWTLVVVDDPYREVALSLARPATALAPGATLSLPITIENRGAATDVVTVDVLAVPTGYSVAALPPLTIAAGATATATITLTTPLNPTTAPVLSIVATSSNGIARDSKPHALEFPITITFALASPTFGVRDGAAGVATARWLDGTGVSNRPIVVEGRADIVPTSVRHSGVTAADGAFPFTLPLDLGAANVLGGHSAVARVDAFGGYTFASARYVVT